MALAGVRTEMRGVALYSQCCDATPPRSFASPERSGGILLR
jgi:hypothetical protein